MEKQKQPGIYQQEVSLFLTVFVVGTVVMWVADEHLNKVAGLALAMSGFFTAWIADWLGDRAQNDQSAKRVDD